MKECFKMKVRVVNKRKDGVSIKVVGGPKMDMSWDEFNDTFEQVDGFIYKTTEKYDNMIQERVNFFQDMMPHMLMLNAALGRDDAEKSLNGYSYLARKTEEFIEKFGGSRMEFLQGYKEYEAAMMRNMISDGIGFGDVHTEKHSFDEETTERNKENVMSIGDMLKGR
jgi:hypothetical protein